MKKETRSKNSITTWDSILDEKYGRQGTAERTEFEMKAQAFVIGALLKEERRKAHLTQEQLAKKTSTKKSYISRIENGHADIQLSTLYRIVEQGLNMKLELSFHEKALAV